MENINDDYDIPRWENYDVNKEEEYLSKIDEFEKYEDHLNAIEYNEYYADNTHLKSESCLVNLRTVLSSYEDKDIQDFFDIVLKCSHMNIATHHSAKNILIVNDNKKFTFLNSITDKITEKGKVKMRREYGDEWNEEDEEARIHIQFVC